MDRTPAFPEPRCLACTGETFRKSVAQCSPGTQTDHVLGRPPHGNENNCFRSAQLSADGSTVITYNEDWKLRTFFITQDILDHADAEPRHLEAYATLESPAHSYAYALYPYYQASDLNTTTVLISEVDLPIRLANAVNLAYQHASYPWINATTEAYIAPLSLLFSPDGTRFIAGAKERIAVFDSSRDGEGPAVDMQTRTSRKARRYGFPGVECRGLISALAIRNDDGLLAAGTTSREVGLWAAYGMGECAATFELDTDDASGNGITEMKWSPCGRYLFIAERKSDALLIYDIRVSGKRLGYTSGRKAMTAQKLGFDVIERNGRYDVWAGGTDGSVRIWENVTSKEDGVEAASSIEAHKDAVSSVILRSYGDQAVLITASGQRRDPQDLVALDEPATAVTPDNTLKIWSI